MILGFFIQVLIVLMAIYYITVIIHILGKGILTYKKINVVKAIIPFYYWIFS